MHELISRISIFSVGVSKYDDNSFRHLKGPSRDIKNIKKILVTNKKTALFKPNQYFELFNPTADDLRKLFNDYIIGRSADNDILILYFSGHGVAIGRNDFGFCTSDTLIHQKTNLPLPLTCIKISEILNSINIANVIPVFIIDACYSGLVGNIHIHSSDAISTINTRIQEVSASSYALFCACSEEQTTFDSDEGGLFSISLFETLLEGKRDNTNNKSLLTLKDLFPLIQEKIDLNSQSNSPKLYIGQTLPEFPLVINTKYKQRSYSLSPTFKKILSAHNNNGRERELSPNEIGEICGKSAYCNHNKLSFTNWDLVNTNPNTKKRFLTTRGKKFINNKISIPKTLVEDPISNKKIPSTNTIFVKYDDI